MSKVYIAEEIISGSNHISGVFSSENEAILFNVKTLISLTNSMWDIPFDSNHNYHAYIINDYISKAMFHDCLLYFNSLSVKDRGDRWLYVTEVDLDPAHNQNLSIIIGVDSSAAKSYQNNINMPLIPSPIFTVPGNSSVPGGGAAGGIISTSPTYYDVEPDTNDVYVAPSPGAKCRGPSCKYESEYAYADREDGTFVCAQCKAFGFEG